METETRALEPPTRSKRGGLSRLGLALLGVALLTAAVWQYRERELIAAAGIEAAQAAVRLALALEAFADARVDELGFVAALLDGEMAAALDFERLAATVPASRELYRWIASIDASGVVLTCTDARRVGKNESGTPWVRALHDQGAGAGLYEAGPGDAPGVVAAVPRRDQVGRMEGGVAGLIPLAVVEQVLERTRQRWVMGERNGPVEYQLVAADGELLVDSSLRQVGLVNLQRLELPSALAVASGLAGYVEEPHLRRHVAVLTGYAGTQATPHWGLLLRVDRDHIVGPLRQQMWRYGGSAALALVAGWGTLGVWRALRRRRVSRPLTPSAASGQPAEHRDAATDVFPSRRENEAMARAQAIHRHISRAVEKLSLGQGVERDAWLHATLAALRTAAGVSGLTLFEQTRSVNPAEWTRAHTSSDPRCNGDHTLRSRTSLSLRRWHERLARGEVVSLQASELLEADRSSCAERGVASLMLVPLFQRLNWTGVLQVEEADPSRVWLPMEIGAWQDAARLLGAAMEFQQRQHGLLSGLCLLERTLDSPQDGIMLVTVSGEIVACNRQFVNMWNVPVSVAAGRDTDQVLAYLLSQVKAPEQFLRALEECDRSDVESYDLIQLIDGRLLERVSERQPFGVDERAMIWRFREIRDPIAVPLDHGMEAKNASRKSQAAVEMATPAADPGETAVAESVRASSFQLETVREEERKRLARELHDQLGQALTGLKLDLSWLSGKLAKDYEALQGKTHAMSEMVSNTIQTVRRISTDLRPPILDDLGLPAAVEWQAREFETRAGVSCTVEIAEELESTSMTQSLVTTVFRIFQETLTNVARHADATAVDVTLATAHRGERPGRWLVLSVRDNGRGISESQVHDPRSMGLAGMRERAMMLGGIVNVEPVRGGGTSVTVHIPMENDHD